MVLSKISKNFSQSFFEGIITQYFTYTPFLEEGYGEGGAGVFGNGGLEGVLLNHIKGLK